MIPRISLTNAAAAPLVAALYLTVALPQGIAGQPSYASVIDSVQPKIVKIYGAGGVQGLEHYQRGFLISPEGHVLTVWSYVLDSEEVIVTLHDGHRFPAELVGADPRLEIAVLKVQATELPHFQLDDAVPLELVTLCWLSAICSTSRPATKRPVCFMEVSPR